MKSTKLIRNFFSVFIFTSIAFKLNGCSGSDDETNITIIENSKNILKYITGYDGG